MSKEFRIIDFYTYPARMTTDVTEQREKGRRDFEALLNDLSVEDWEVEAMTGDEVVTVLLSREKKR